MPTQNAKYFDQFESESDTPQDKDKSYFDQFDSEQGNETVNNKSSNIDSPRLFRSPMQARFEGFGAGAYEGLKGFIKGATIDIPSSIIGGIKGAYNLAKDPLNFGPNVMKGISDTTGNLIDSFENAGSEPEQFGRLMGNITGQPLVTAGIAKGTPSAIRGTGHVIEPVGKFIKDYRPMTGMPVISPLAGRNLNRIERVTGAGIEKLGQGMKNVGKNNQVIIPTEVPLEIPNVPAKSFKVIRNEIPEGESLSPIAKEYMAKKKLRANRDGTFTDTVSGEVVNSKGESIIEINGKPLDKNSSLFKKNQLESNSPIKSAYESKRLPKHEPWGALKDYNKVTLESPTGQRMTIEDLIKQTGTKNTAEQILDEMATGQGLQKYGYKIIG